MDGWTDRQTQADEETETHYKQLLDCHSSSMCCAVCICFFTHAEVTQEVAARGLGLTYDLCDSSTREEMVQSLVGTLMEGRK